MGHTRIFPERESRKDSSIKLGVDVAGIKLGCSMGKLLG